MSNTDPDLQPKESNLPIAIDVVDGNLIVKRHGGRKESFPLGGSVKDEDWLDWFLESIGMESSTDLLGLTTASGTSLYDKDYTNLQDVEPTSLTTDGQGFVVGDNFVMSSGNVYFRKTGLYLVTINYYNILVDGNWSFLLYTTGVGSKSTYFSKLVEANSVRVSEGQMVFTVTSDTLLRTISGELWTPGDPINSSSQGLGVNAYQNSGSPQDLSIELYVSRISG